MVTKLHRKSLWEVGSTTMCPERNRKSQESSTVPVCVSYVNSTPRVLTTVETFRQRISHHPVVPDNYGAVTNGKDTTIKLHSAEHAGLAQCNPAPSLYCSTNSQHIIFNNCSIFGPGNGVSYPLSSSRTCHGASYIHQFCMSTCFALPNPLRLTRHIATVESRCRFNPHTVSKSFSTL